MNKGKDAMRMAFIVYFLCILLCIDIAHEMVHSFNTNKLFDTFIIVPKYFDARFYYVQYTALCCKPIYAKTEHFATYPFT